MSSLRADGPEDRMEFSKKCAALLVTNDYAQLEELGQRLRTKKEKFTEGVWMLPRYYEGLEAPKNLREEKRANYWAQLDAWEKEFPDSLTVPVLKAHNLTAEAWEARGNGYASTVTDTGWKVFGQKLQEARVVLEQAKKKGEVCPEWYGTMMTVALGQNWPLEKFDVIFEEAVRREPTYYDYYFSKAYYLLPRWHGATGEWEAFAEEASTHSDPEEGLAVYARSAWSLANYYKNLFTESKIEWPKMRQGFRDIIKSYPDSFWNLKNFIQFAFQAHDIETVRELLPLIEAHPEHSRWKNDTKLLEIGKWAKGQEEH